MPDPTGRAAPPDAQRTSRDGLATLTDVCTDDLMRAFGLDGARLPRLLFRFPARRLARQAMAFDRVVGDEGLAAGGAWALARMCRGADVSGGEFVPRRGPLLVVANHPGFADTVALFAALPRDDARVLAAERPFLAALPNARARLFTFPETPSGRFAVVRAAARHLRAGGALLTFPAGGIEPDPAVLPGAAEALESWSASVGLFARLAPGLAVVPAIVSGVLSRAALANPVTRVRRRREDREWLAATLQVLTPSLYGIRVRVEFGPPIHADGGSPVAEAVLDAARRIVSAHGARRG